MWSSCQIISRQRSTDSHPAHFPILQILIKSEWIVILLHRKQIRYSETIGGKCFLIIHLHWMCTPSDTQQKWSFDCFCLRVNYWNNKCISETPSFTSRDIPIFLLFCLFVWSFSSQSKIFHSFGDVSIAGERLQILTMVINQWGFFSVPHILRQEVSVDNGHLRGPLHSHLMPSI